MNIHNAIIATSLQVITLIVMAIGLYMGIERVDKYLELKARTDCAQISRYTVAIPKDNVTVSYPVEELYRKCLDEKGY